jgi:hypothetical protein
LATVALMPAVSTRNTVNIRPDFERTKPGIVRMLHPQSGTLIMVKNS